MSRTGPRRAAQVLALSLSITVIGLVGVAGHSSAAPTPAAVLTRPATVPPETAPPETAPPETAPPATAAPDTIPTTVPAGEDDGIDVGTWVLVTLIVVLAIIVISAVVTGIGRRAKTKPTPVVAPVPPASDNARQLVASAQWVHDQMSLELMAAAPAQALQRWTVERTRIDNIVIGAQAEASRTNNASWLQLGQFLSELAAAIDTNLQLRMQDPPNVGMVQESANVITARRSDIQAAINLLRPTLG